MEIEELLQNIQESINEYQDDNVEELELRSGKVYCDGAGTNGSISKICYHDGLNPVVKVLPPISNNDAEYFAVLYAIMNCKKGDVISSDSQIVVKQIGGSFRCTAPKFRLIAPIARFLLDQKKVKLIWEGRSFNLAGKYLETHK